MFNNKNYTNCGNWASRGLALVSFVCVFLTGCTRIEPGYVGIKVNLYGSNRGVEDYPIKTGRVWYNPVTDEIYEYPTFMQNRVWTEDINEASPVSEAITFNSKEGATITADISINYQIEGDKVPSLFVEFRKDAETLTETYLRNQVRDAFNRLAGHYKAVDIFGEGKQNLLDEVKIELDEKLRPKGFLIDLVSFIGSPRADSRVMASINSVIESTQKAIEAENKIRQSTAEARQRVEEANGIAESRLKVAEAEAKSNRIIAESITDNLIQYKKYDKWDGVAPKYMGGDASILVQE